MKLREAISRYRFQVTNGNKPNETDIQAFNVIAEHLQQTQEKTIQENLLFAKLYTFVLENFVINYNNVDFANKELNKILSEPIDLRIEYLTKRLQTMEVTQVFADPMLVGKSGEELKEIFKRYPKFEQDFLTCYEWWSKDNVISHLNTQINLSIQKFKNYV